MKVRKRFIPVVAAVIAAAMTGAVAYAENDSPDAGIGEEITAEDLEAVKVYTDEDFEIDENGVLTKYKGSGGDVV